MKTLFSNQTTLQDPLTVPEQRTIIDNIIADNKNTPGAAMLVLDKLQDEIGDISEPMQQYIAQELKIPVSHLHGVVTFYSFFLTKPHGKHTIKFCTGTACYVGGSQQLIDKAKQLTGINIGETANDGSISLETCRCVGACSQAPVIVVDEDVHGRVKPNSFPQLLRKVQSSNVDQ